MTALTYSSYLQVDELLALQRCQSEGPEHDEMLFIIIHQVYELWFKQLLHEIDFVQKAFGTNNTARVLQTLKRVLLIIFLAAAAIRYHQMCSHAMSPSPICPLQRCRHPCSTYTETTST